MLECNSADTGVGPSIADGSHGWSPNWADFPMAARSRPISGIGVKFGLSMKICCMSHELELSINQARAMIRPMSPIRLYRTACSAAVLASARPYHHPISRNDIMPTPSQPMNSWNRLLAVTRMIIVIRNNSKYLKNWLMYGSECIYHMENSMMDHVTKSATGTNISEK